MTGKGFIIDKPYVYSTKLQFISVEVVKRMWLRNSNLSGMQERGRNTYHRTFFGLIDMNEAQSETLFHSNIIHIEFEAPMGQDAQQHTDD